jgi:hypothetical protein
MHTLDCIDAHGNPCVFVYDFSFDRLEQQWRFKVQTDPPLPSQEFFNMTLKVLEDGRLRVIMMNSNEEVRYRRKGIPEALLLAAKDHLKEAIESSPRHGTSLDIRRNEQASKYWKRLEARGLAVHDTEHDVYRLL